MSGMTKAERLTELKRRYIQRACSDMELAESLGVRRETIFRDRKELAEKYEFIKDQKGRWKIDRSTLLSEIKVNLHEALVLYLAARKTSRQTYFQHTHAISAVDKLATVLYQPMAKKLLRATERALEQEKAPERIKIIENITQGWVEQREVRIEYQAFGAKASKKHVIRPYLIEPSLWSDSVYVIAHSDKMSGIVPFKIDRVTHAFLSGATFELPENFDEEELLKHAWGIWYGDKKPITVKLRFSAKAAQRVKESKWHPLEMVDDTEDGGCIWQADLAEWREMLPWIRGWGADVEALEPEALRKALVREAKRLTRIYGVGEVDNVSERYYAHTKDDTDESEWQLLKDHLQRTGEIAFELGADAGISELARTAGLLHDIGKYSKEFQARLRGSKRRVDHATAGAREIMRLFPNLPHKDFAELLSYCIAGHHSGLPDYGSPADVGTDGTLLARREKKKIKDYQAYKNEFGITAINFQPRSVKPSRFRFAEEEQLYSGFSVAFLTRMIFSTLTDADWLETERFVQGDRKKRGQHASLKTLAQQFNDFLTSFDNPTNEINRKRTETLKACLEKAPKKPGFFTLTVPTGGGKTFASMAFALNHAVKNDLKRVIYVIPFTSIIEQNAGEFRKALGDLGDKNILEHHSNFDWEEKKKVAEKEADDETTKIRNKLKLAAENWNVPIVVTTNVQFFESLFASKKKSARKLHSIAKSVIIFDEAQMLPREYLKPSLLAVQELVNNYGATAVFCTATQPSLERFFPKEIGFTELAPNPQELFDFYRRVKVQNLNVQTDEELLDNLNSHPQALCIVNTRKHAKGLYDQLDEDGSFHLSTLMCPVHRKEILKEIRQRLKDGQVCRVVSTQVMEAGIDVDFPVGYRALAGLDSIIQAAGRVNREGKQTSGDMFVFTSKTEFIKRTPIFIKQTGAVAESVLRDFGNDPTSKSAIEAYYEQFYSLQSEESFDTKKILGYFDRPIEVGFKFKTAAENFKFIDNNTVSVIIPFDNDAKKLIQELMYTEYPMSTIRKLQSYTVNIYEKEFTNLQSKGVIETIGEQYHVLDESRVEAYYHPKTGLLLPECGSGEAIFIDR